MAQRIHIWAQCLSFPRFHYSVVGMLFCVSDIFCLVFGCLSVYTRTEVVSNGVILRLAEAVAQVNCKLIVQFWNLSIDLELFLFFLNYRKTPQSTFLIYNIYMFICSCISFTIPCSCLVGFMSFINIYVPCYSKYMQSFPRENCESVITLRIVSFRHSNSDEIHKRSRRCLQPSAFERRRKCPACRMSPERPSGSETRHERFQYPNDIVLFILPSLKYSHSSPILLAYAQIGTKHLGRSRRMGNAGPTGRLWRPG